MAGKLRLQLGQVMWRSHAGSEDRVEWERLYDVKRVESNGLSGMKGA